MTVAAGDHASQLEGAAKELLTVNSSFARCRKQLETGLSAVESKLGAAMTNIDGISANMKAFDAATGSAHRLTKGCRRSSKCGRIDIWASSQCLSGCDRQRSTGAPATGGTHCCGCEACV